MDVNKDFKNRSEKENEVLIELHKNLSKFFCAKCNLVETFGKFMRSDQKKYFDGIINAREMLFNHLYELTVNVDNYFYIPNDLQECIKYYVNYCEKEHENGSDLRRIHFSPITGNNHADDLTFKYVDEIFSLTEKYTHCDIKKPSNIDCN
ncbi:MAG: hypothetical protein LBT10_02270 [Methanobrevibacter sp.]|jgi:hypothetical protein|nr:hypothetical protein [Methanobrevibacter sp.]